MYLGIDIGGTKTLLASFNSKGEVAAQLKFPTPEDYDEFLDKVKESLAKFKANDFQGAVVAVPGRLDRERGVALGYGTLKWKRESIEADIERIVNCPVTIENDSKLAGLSEALLIKNDFNNVLYVTIGTGISAGIIINGMIDKNFANSESGQMWFDYHGKRMQWEDFASGRAIVAKYGKQASDIDSSESWKEISHAIAIGMIELIAIIQPEVIVIGGGVGVHFDKFKGYLQSELKKYETPLVPMPPLRRAHRPQEAVIYGCYELARRTYG